MSFEGCSRPGAMEPPSTRTPRPSARYSAAEDVHRHGMGAAARGPPSNSGTRQAPTQHASPVPVRPLAPLRPCHPSSRSNSLQRCSPMQGGRFANRPYGSVHVTGLRASPAEARLLWDEERYWDNCGPGLDSRSNTRIPLLRSSIVVYEFDIPPSRSGRASMPPPPDPQVERAAPQDPAARHDPLVLEYAAQRLRRRREVGQQDPYLRCFLGKRAPQRPVVGLPVSVDGDGYVALRRPVADPAQGHAELGPSPTQHGS